MKKKKTYYLVVSSQLFDINLVKDSAKIAIVGISPGFSQTKTNKDIPDDEKRYRECTFSNRIKKMGIIAKAVFEKISLIF